MHYDLAIIGGGIVGLATAHQFLRQFPGKRLLLLEKEPQLAAHQTGHNSGVLHSGIYYKPGSLKAINCRSGKKLMEQFCAEENIAHEICGKVIVAIDEHDLPALHQIYERGQANGIRCELIDRPRLNELEPHAAGIKAIHVPEAGIVNYKHVCERLAGRVRQAGGELRLGTRVTGINHRQQSVTICSTTGEYEASILVNCAGLHSDRITKLTGQPAPAQIIPFRGEYYELTAAAKHLCRHLIYPTPDPAFPFLGVHFTRMIDGRVECGPNAVLAFGRESYRFFKVNGRDLAETLAYRGFLRLAMKHWKMGLTEMGRSLSKNAFVRALQRLIPAITAADLTAAPAGIRAQAVAPDGRLVDDFLIQQGSRVVNVCNAPSPAATASLQIGITIVDHLVSRFQ